jgi:hypothetical protein
MAKYNVFVQISGSNLKRTAIITRVSNALRRAGASQAEIDAFREEAKGTSKQPFGYLLDVVKKWVRTL